MLDWPIAWWFHVTFCCTHTFLIHRIALRDCIKGDYKLHKSIIENQMYTLCHSSLQLPKVELDFYLKSSTIRFVKDETNH